MEFVELVVLVELLQFVVLVEFVVLDELLLFPTPKKSLREFETTWNNSGISCPLERNLFCPLTRANAMNKVKAMNFIIYYSIIC